MYYGKDTTKGLKYLKPVLELYVRDFMKAWEKRINDVKDDDTDYGSSTHNFNR